MKEFLCIFERIRGMTMLECVWIVFNKTNTDRVKRKCFDYKIARTVWICTAVSMVIYSSISRRHCCMLFKLRRTGKYASCEVFWVLGHLIRSYTITYRIHMLRLKYIILYRLFHFKFVSFRDPAFYRFCELKSWSLLL